MKKTKFKFLLSFGIQLIISISSFAQEGVLIIDQNSSSELLISQQRRSIIKEKLKSGSIGPYESELRQQRIRNWLLGVKDVLRAEQSAKRANMPLQSKEEMIRHRERNLDDRITSGRIRTKEADFEIRSS